MDMLERTHPASGTPASLPALSRSLPLRVRTASGSDRIIEATQKSQTGPVATAPGSVTGTSLTRSIHTIRDRLSYAFPEFVGYRCSEQSTPDRKAQLRGHRRSQANR